MEQVRDIVIKLHLNPHDELDENLVKIVVKALTRSVYPLSEEIVFIPHNPNPEGAHLAEIRTLLDKVTVRQLKDALKAILEHKFDVGGNVEPKGPLNSGDQIDATVAWFKVQLQPINNIPAWSTLAYLDAIAMLGMRAERRAAEQRARTAAIMEQFFSEHGYR